MAIKAIINNTEKEIEQIKDSDEQDVDYVYSRIGDTEVEGESPISIKSIGGELANYRIYGNTVDGESVGDRTGNLFDGNFLQGYWADADGLFVVSNKWISTKKIPCKANAQYTFSSSFLSRWAGFFWYDENDNYLSNNTAYNITLLTETSPSNAAYMAIDIASYPTWEYTISPSDVTDFMLVEGSTPLPYEPYGYKVPVTVEGKNLLQNTVTSRTINGVTFTVNSDGSITCNGTANASAPSVLYIPFTLPIKLYELSGCPDSGSASTYRVDIRKNDNSMYKYNGNSVVDNGTGCLFDGGNNQYCIRIAPNYTCDNLTFYPMIRKADIEDDTYEPYQSPVTTPIYLPEQIRKVGDEAEYIDYGEQKFHRISGVNLDVNLPALSTIKGTNTFSVNTSIQPSYIYIKDNFDYKKVFTATRVIEDELPLNYKNIEDNDSTLSNYRIYGNTVGGAGVGDLVESGEHAGEYEVSVTISNGTDALTTPIYLPEQIKKLGDYIDYIDYGSQKFVRRVVRKVFDGTENIKYYGPFGVQNHKHFYYDIGTGSWINIKEMIAPWSNKYLPYKSWASVDIGDRNIRYQYGYNQINPYRFYFTDDSISSVEDFKTMLADWYANGDPLIVDYIIVKPVEEQVTLPALPTLPGTNVLSVGTAVQPSEVYIKGKIKEAN